MKKKTDAFAQIAADGIRYRDGVKEQTPPQKAGIYFKNSGDGIFKPLHKMTTEEELSCALAEMREERKPFMQDLAPVLPLSRKREYLTDFQWRIQTKDDITNFLGTLGGEGKWENIKVPHYGAPLGKAATIYRTEFSFDVQPGKRAILVFKAVDYIAKVFLNGSYLGSHEGFFAPFSFDVTPQLKDKNTLVVVVENDNPCGADGNKIYAATGLGYDDSQEGWHHCPAGMGIYQDVYVEECPEVYVSDIFVRPMVEQSRAELWLELCHTGIEKREIEITVEVYGQNFKSDPLKIDYRPNTPLEVGMGDSLTEADRIRDGSLGKAIPLLISNGLNTFKIPIDMNGFRYWSPGKPWLYQVQITLKNEKGEPIDCKARQFGMRSFKMDTDSEIKGAFYLNGEKVRLRGANTMGHEQQCVFKKDFAQLIDDILLAKICNMNFLRITQRPVQEEIYDYCDRLGLMIQTDLPLFGVLRRNQFCEAARQAEEMEKLVRSHPCNIMVTYINEPFPNASNRPHLHLTREELVSFFHVADTVVHLNNPDRVIKQIDGDYDPPCYGFPDNHCYPAWYNGHGIELGKLNIGYWLPTKPDWYHGCGEFGAEGLDPVCVMKKYYPKEWLPEKDDDPAWSPNSIIKAQTGNFHYFFYDTPETLQDWVSDSQRHQAWAARFMTEAFRRDARMVTFAIHLFIDAFPSGWMKTIMDLERRPKPAYFAYKEALTPLMVNLRTDRLTFFDDEDIKLEAWLCNDTNEKICGELRYYAETADGKRIASGVSAANCLDSDAAFQGYIKFKAPEVKDREMITVHLALCGENGEVRHDTSICIEVFANEGIEAASVLPIGKEAELLAAELGLGISESADKILVSDIYRYAEIADMVKNTVENGADVIFLNLPEGVHDIMGSEIDIKPCSMLPVNFVSRKTGHDIVKEFRPADFRLWYDEKAGYITPILYNTFLSDDFAPILTSGNLDNNGDWNPALAVGEKQVGKGKAIICQLHLSGRTHTNPIAKRFANNIFNI